MDEKYDAVERPQHYAGQGEVECIDFIEIVIKNYNSIVAGCLFNVIKYIWRVHNKNGKQDLEKALWYAKRAVSKLNFYKETSACTDCAMFVSAKLSVEETLMVMKAVKQITDILNDEESKFFMNIISCIINGGLINGTKDYSNNLIESIEQWILMYQEK